MCQELPGALFAWVVDQLLCRALFHHHAAVHKQDAVGHIPGKVHLVGDDDHGGLAVGQFPQHSQHLAGQLRVKGAGGLVEAEDVRVQCQRTGNGYPLLLPAGKLVRVVVCPLIDQSWCGEGPARAESPICASSSRACCSSWACTAFLLAR